MNKPILIVSFAVLYVLTGVAVTGQNENADLKEQVVQVERAFAATMAKRDRGV